MIIEEYHLTFIKRHVVYIVYRSKSVDKFTILIDIYASIEVNSTEFIDN